jgi:bla regulator protein BlaR1
MKTPLHLPASVRRQAAFVALLLAMLVTLPSLALASKRHTHVYRHSHDPAWVGPIVIPPIPPLPPIPAIVVPTVPVPRVMVTGARHVSRIHAYDSHWESEDPDRFAWALVGGDSDCMSGSLDDEVLEVLEHEARAGGAPVLWLRVDGDEWLVRDRALVRRADAILEPLHDLGRQMGALGGEQGRLGARQGRLGARVGRLAARRAALEVRLATEGWRDEDIRLSDRELARLERELARLERSIDREEMTELGQQMGRMGRRMGELSKRAEREMRALAREAISGRKAQRLRDIDS